MYMRLLFLKLKPGMSLPHRAFYERRILPELEKMGGCLYATLTEGADRPDECVSLTLWETLNDLEAYQKSGKFEELLKERQAFLADSDEWRVQLAEDLTLQYLPVNEEPAVKSCSVHAVMDREALPHSPGEAVHLRLLRYKVQAGKMDEARRGYTEGVIPALRAVPGCRYACLLASLEAENELISLTIWDSSEDAERYERSALYRRLMSAALRFMPAAYQWKMALERDYRGQIVTSEDVKVQSYAVVAGATFEPARTP